MSQSHTPHQPPPPLYALIQDEVRNEARKYATRHSVFIDDWAAEVCQKLFQYWTANPHNIPSTLPAQKSYIKKTVHRKICLKIKGLSYQKTGYLDDASPAQQATIEEQSYSVTHDEAQQYVTSREAVVLRRLFDTMSFTSTRSVVDYWLMWLLMTRADMGEYLARREVEEIDRVVSAWLIWHEVEERGAVVPPHAILHPLWRDVCGELAAQGEVSDASLQALMAQHGGGSVSIAQLHQWKSRARKRVRERCEEEAITYDTLGDALQRVGAALQLHGAGGVR